MRIGVYFTGVVYGWLLQGDRPGAAGHVLVVRVDGAQEAGRHLVPTVLRRRGTCMPCLLAANSDIDMVVVVVVGVVPPLPPPRHTIPTCRPGYSTRASGIGKAGAYLEIFLGVNLGDALAEQLARVAVHL